VSPKLHKTNNYKLKSQRSWAGTTFPSEKLCSVDVNLIPFQGPGTHQLHLQRMYINSFPIWPRKVLSIEKDLAKPTCQEVEKVKRYAIKRFYTHHQILAIRSHRPPNPP
jgi:hypothetical protein